ncbi:hypothetical protein PS896_03122 [Pseudomonas fluorescens]|uniref:Uncharacterized protein n=1 Tax=Pseudomonas fluorescens TaxID=294 RepID=A0A5E7L148_PSEFL|nr:hypothetical protein [Pseudomonas fluorescens]VVP06931.1 hypothetical protein PS896_03122 [Pseudomonas fluorescens]
MGLNCYHAISSLLDGMVCGSGDHRDGAIYIAACLEASRLIYICFGGGMTKRQLRFYDLKVKAAARYEVNNEMISTNVVAFPLLDIMKQAVTVFDSVECLYRELPNEIKFYLADICIEEDESKVTLLINKSDPTEPDQTISNPILGERQDLEKPDGFGNDYSAHVCINLNPIGPNLYSMVYESPRGGIPGAQVHSFINHLFRECRAHHKSAYKVAHPAGVMEDGRPVLVNALHTVDLNGKISDDFLNDLANGSLGRIELANYKNVGRVWDDSAGLKEEKNIIILRPEVAHLPAEGVLDALKQAFTKGSNFDYDEAVIVFKDPYDTQHTVVMNTEDFTLSDNEKYVKKAYIVTPDVNANGYGEIDNDIKNALYAAL